MTGKMKLFAYFYPREKLNATAAAKKAGYSEKTAYSQGQRLLKNVEIKAAIQKEIKLLLSDTELLTLQWLDQVKRISFSNIKDIFDDTNDLKNIIEIDDDIAMAIESVEVVQTYNKETEEDVYTKKIKMSNKTKGLELLGKYLAILQDNPPENETETQRLSKEERKNRIIQLNKQLGK